MHIVTTKHGFKFSVEADGFSGQEDAKERGEAYIEAALDRLSASTAAAIFGASVAQVYGQNIQAGSLDALDRIAAKGQGVATKAWHRPDAAFFTVSAWLDLDAA